MRIRTVSSRFAEKWPSTGAGPSSLPGIPCFCSHLATQVNTQNAYKHGSTGDRLIRSSRETARIGLKRIDMIAAHDTFARLGEIRQPTLVVCGTHNFCTPLPLSEELATKIPGARLVVFEEGGELIELEQDEKYFRVVSGFVHEQTIQNRG